MRKALRRFWLAFGILIILGIGREVWMHHIPSVLVWGSNQGIAIKYNNDIIFVWGEENTKERLYESLNPYFNGIKKVNMNNLNVQNEMSFDSFSIMRSSHEVWEMNIMDERWVFIDRWYKPDEEYVREAFESGADVLVLYDARILKDWEVKVQKGIIWMGEQYPSNALERLARQNGWWILAPKEQGEFLLRAESGVWELKKR